MTKSQGSLLLRKTHWKLDPITDEQYKKLSELILMGTLKRKDASTLIDNLFTIEENNRGRLYPKLYEEEAAKVAEACESIQTVLTNY